jgi:anti-sigma B factor antagonist
MDLGSDSKGGLDVRAERVGDVVVVRVAGEVDLWTAPVLGPYLTAGPPLVVDLSGVTFLAAAGLTLLVTANRRCRDLGGSMTLVRPQRNVLRVLRLANVLHVLDFADSMTKAVTAVVHVSPNGHH